MNRRGRHTLFLGLIIVGVALALVIGPGAAAQDSGEARTAPSSSLARILSPHAEGIARSGRRVTMRVRTRSVGGLRFEAFLGAKSITGRFSRPRKGVRTARVRVPRGQHRLIVRTTAGGREDFDRVFFAVARRDRSLIRARHARRSKPRPALSVRVRLRRPVRVFTARLNGRRISGSFKAHAGGLRTISIDVDHGMHFGLNRLVLSAATKDGRYDRQSHTFRVRRVRPLTGAGPRRLGKVGKGIRLSGAHSRPAARNARLRYRWRIVSKPGGSHARLRGARRLRPTLVPDKHGRYVVKLTVRQLRGGRSVGATPVASDTVELEAAPQLFPIGWRLETIAAGGIKLNGAIAQVPGKGALSGGNWVQLLVLSRTTLAIDRRRSGVYNLDKAGSLSNAINGTSSGQIVILTGAGHSAKLSSNQVSTLRSAFSRLGGTTAPFHSTNSNSDDPGFGTGQWSIVGRPGLKKGQAVQSFAIATGGVNAPGALGGYLQRDSSNQFTYVPQDYTAFDTVAKGSSPTSNKLTVGAASYTKARTAGATAGFHLVALDGSTLAPRANEFYATNKGAGQADVTGLQSLAHRINGFTDAAKPAVVILQSIGNPQPKEATWTTDLAPAVARIGGAPDVLNNLDGKGGYTLVGGSKVRDGDEQSTRVTGKPARLTGVLSRNEQSQYAGNYEDPTGTYKLDILDVAFRKPEPFPAWTTNGQVLAYQAVGKVLGMLHQRDLRLNYWDNTSARFGTEYSQLFGIQYADFPAPNFTSDDFTAVKGELLKEFKWVSDIRNWVGDLGALFHDSESTSYVNLESIAHNIESAVQPSGSSETESVGMGILSEALFVASGFVPGGELAVGPEVALVAGLFGAAAEYTTLPDNQPLASLIKVRADELASNLRTGYDRATTGLERLADIIVSDYGKMKVAGPAVIDQWSFNTTKDVDVTLSLERSARHLFASALVPEVYDTYTALPSRRTDLSPPGGYNPNPTDPKTYRCASSGGPGEISHPWGNVGSTGWASVLEGFDKDGKPVRRPHTMSGFIDINQFDVVEAGYSDVAPPKSLTDALFKFSDDKTSGGLYKEPFMARDLAQHDIHC